MLKFKDNPLSENDILIKDKTKLISLIFDISEKYVIFLLFILKSYKGLEVIHIDIIETARYFNVSKKSIYNYINKLCDKQIIAPTPIVNIYHLNPCVYNGYKVLFI